MKKICKLLIATALLCLPQMAWTQKADSRFMSPFVAYRIIGDEPKPLLVVEGKQDKRPLKVWTIGDSNGAIAHGWTTQLQNMLPNGTLLNNSESGRTIGFDNLGRTSLNALRNIDTYIAQAEAEIGDKPFDFVILCLGTNDTKADFKDRQDEISGNYGQILDKLLASKVFESGKTKLILVSPPPMRAKNMEEKYWGSSERIKDLIPVLKKEAKKRHLTYVNIYKPLEAAFTQYAQDGVHMNATGQLFVAQKILRKMK